jgi:hypothetical protein
VRYAGLRVRITKQSVAREARVSSATLYRFPDLVERIGDIVGDHQEQRLRPSEERRAKLVKQVEELERRVAALLTENLRLMRLLANHDSTFGETKPSQLELARARRPVKFRN